MPGLIGAGLGVLGNVASSLIGNAGSKKRQDQANADNIKFWNLQNEYNNPSSQMERLRKAGLNPNLIYGTSPSSAVGNAEGIAPSKPAEYKMQNPMQDIGLHADFKQKEAQTDNLKSQNTVNQQEALLKSAQTQKTASEGQSAQVKAQIDTELRNTSADLVREQLRQSKQSTLQSFLDTKYKNNTLKDRIMDIHERALNSKATRKGTELTNDLKKYEKELNELGIQKDDNAFLRILGFLYQQNKSSFKF